jgi:dolichol-phosphate mannosyltransferase
VYILIAKILLNQPFQFGIVTITLLILFMGGAQLVSIGILGEYIGRIYDEVKERPQYIVGRAVNVRTLQTEHAG